MRKKSFRLLAPVVLATFACSVVGVADGSAASATTNDPLDTTTAGYSNLCNSIYARSNSAIAGDAYVMTYRDSGGATRTIRNDMNGDDSRFFVDVPFGVTSFNYQHIGVDGKVIESKTVSCRSNAADNGQGNLSLYVYVRPNGFQMHTNAPDANAFFQVKFYPYSGAPMESVQIPRNQQWQSFVDEPGQYSISVLHPETSGSSSVNSTYVGLDEYSFFRDANGRVTTTRNGGELSAFRFYGNKNTTSNYWLMGAEFDSTNRVINVDATAPSSWRYLLYRGDDVSDAHNAVAEYVVNGDNTYHSFEVDKSWAPGQYTIEVVDNRMNMVDSRKVFVSAPVSTSTPSSSTESSSPTATETATSSPSDSVSPTPTSTTYSPEPSDSNSSSSSSSTQEPTASETISPTSESTPSETVSPSESPSPATTTTTEPTTPVATSTPATTTSPTTTVTAPPAVPVTTPTSAPTSSPTRSPGTLPETVAPTPRPTSSPVAVVPTITRTFQVDTYLNPTAVLSRAAARYDDDSFLKFREDIKHWGHSRVELVTVTLPKTASLKQWTDAINKATRRVDDVRSNRKIDSVKVKQNVTIAWLVRTDLGAVGKLNDVRLFKAPQVFFASSR